MLRRAIGYFGEKYFGAASGRQCFELAIASLGAGSIPAAEAAIAQTFRRLRETPDFDIQFNAGVIRARGGKLAQAEEHLKEALRLFPSSTHAAYALGSIRAMRGDIAGALEMFKADLPVMTGTGQPTYTNALYLEDSGAGVERSRVLEMGAIAPASGSRAIYLVVSDSVYFCRYAVALARSIRLNSGSDIHLHAHVINPTTEASELASTLAQAGSLSVSTESTELDDLTDDQRKTYYASARFLLLKELSARFQKPILVCDIDQLVMADVEPILRTGQGKDVSLIRFDGQSHNILSLISATALLVMPTKGAAWFCNALEQNISNALAHPARLTWHLDQAALAMAYVMFPSVKHGMIPSSMIHLTAGEPAPGRPADTGILWSITNSIDGNLAKLKTETFQRLLSA